MSTVTVGQYSIAKFIEDQVREQHVRVVELDTQLRSLDDERRRILAQKAEAQAALTDSHRRRLEQATSDLNIMREDDLRALETAYSTANVEQRQAVVLHEMSECQARIEEIMADRTKFATPSSSPPRPGLAPVIAGLVVLALLGLLAVKVSSGNSSQPRLGPAAPATTALPTTTSTTLPAWEQWPTPVLSQWEGLAQTVATDQRIATKDGFNLFYKHAVDKSTGKLVSYDHWQLIMATVTFGCGGNAKCPQTLDNGNWVGMIPMEVSPRLIDLAAKELKLPFDLTDPKTNLLIWARYMNDQAEPVYRSFKQPTLAQLLGIWVMPHVSGPKAPQAFWTDQTRQDFWDLYTGWGTMTTARFAAIEGRSNNRIARLIDAAHIQDHTIQGG